MKLKTLLATIWAFVANLWKKIDQYVGLITPIAIRVVDALKSINESFTGDIIEMLISKAIPGTADDLLIRRIRVKLKTILPKILLQLNMAESIAGITDPNEQLKAIILKINMSSDEAKNAYYHSLSVMILQRLADGKLSWSESVQIAEYYYTNIYKK